jgi:hypothetical protein
MKMKFAQILFCFDWLMSSDGTTFHASALQTHHLPKQAMVWRSCGHADRGT